MVSGTAVSVLQEKTAVIFLVAIENMSVARLTPEDNHDGNMLLAARRDSMPGVDLAGAHDGHIFR